MKAPLHKDSELPPLDGSSWSRPDCRAAGSAECWREPATSSRSRCGLLSDLVSKAGPLQGLLAYAGAVLWALVGMVVNQYDLSLLITGAALLSRALVARASINTLRTSRTHLGAGLSIRP